MLDIIGTFRVTKLKTLGNNIYYELLFLKDKVLFIKSPSQFAGSSLGSMFGSVAGGSTNRITGISFDIKNQQSADKKKVKSPMEMSEDDLVKLDKKNFALPYEEIKKVLINNSEFSANGSRTGELVIVSKKTEEYDISPVQNYTDCEKIIRTVLSDKLG